MLTTTVADLAITGTETGGGLGRSLVFLDFDGDDCDDIAAGAPGEGADDGAVYLIFGGTL